MLSCLEAPHKPKSTMAFSITCNEPKSVSPAVRASASHFRTCRASPIEEMRQAPVKASVTSASGAPCVTRAACNAACSRRSSVSRRFSSIGIGCQWSVVSSPLREHRTTDNGPLTTNWLASVRLKTCCSSVAKMECLVFKVRCLHLDCQMVDAKPLVKLCAQHLQQVWLRNAVGVDDMRT